MCQNAPVARFLFVVLPLASHLNPAVAIGQALAADGHEVAYCGPRSDLTPLLHSTDAIYPTGKRVYRQDAEVGMAAIRSLWEGYVVPYNRFVLEAADRAVTDYAPDVVVADQYALAGALAAHRHGVRWASFCVGMLELTPPPPHELPGLDAYVQEQAARVWAMAGLPVPAGIDLRFSPDLVIGLTTRALTGEVPLPPQCALVGPALGRRPAVPDVDWPAWDPARRHVLVTVGTVSVHMAEDFYRRMVLALEPLAQRVQALVIAPPELVPGPPSHVAVAPRVPVLDLMPRLDAVVCHGGLNTVAESFTHGLPLVVAPLRHDQPTIAAQVVAAGAGIAVPFASASPEQLTAALEAVLGDPAYTRNARAIGDSFAAAGGAATAATRLAGLASYSD